MKTHDTINPLVNPVMDQDVVKCNHEQFTVKMGFDCNWAIYENDNFVQGGIESQIDLCAWFINRGNQNETHLQRK